MSAGRPETFEMDWQGIVLSVSFDADWSNLAQDGFDGVAHLQVRAILPSGAPLPITDTGYRSHFLAPANVEAAGGSLAYVRLWLDQAAIRPEWRASQERDRQTTLF